MRRNQLESRKELINRLLSDYGTDTQVLGIIQVGSVAKGYDDKHSDVDLEIVVTEDKYAELARNSQKIVHTEKYDLRFTTAIKLRRIKDSDTDEDHWDYQKSIVLQDKTRILQKILNEIITYNEASRVDRLKRHYKAYWENTLNTISCLEHENQWGAKIYAALSIQELIRVLFNFNHQWSPRLQWAFREIQTLQKKPKKLKTQLESILNQPETSKLSRIWNQTASLLREEKYTWIDHPAELLL
jgi:predicted nucleotidyltransferase